MWFLGASVAAVTALVTTTLLMGWCPNSVLAAMQLLTPWWMVLTALVTLGAAWEKSWALSVSGFAVVTATLAVVVPKLRRSPRQDRSRERDATLTIALANLYIDNPEPDEAIRQLLSADPDILVMTELSTGLLERFDALGGADRFPNRIHPEPMEGEYEAGIFSRLPFQSASVWDKGPLQVIEASVRIDGHEPLRVIAIHPEAPVNGKSFRRWRRQLDQLDEILADSGGPTVALGDLNAGTLQPPYERLLRSRIRDAHDELGVALRPSWGVAPWLPRWFPTLLARLDHLLLSPDVEIVSVGDLDAVGSDHRPFLAELRL